MAAHERDRSRPEAHYLDRVQVGMRDVARKAGVSTASVSRAMNSPQLVSPRLRERIEAAARALNWVPDGAARALTTGRSGAIGAVFPTLTHGDFARAAEALQAELSLSGYSLLLACSRYEPAQEVQLVRQFIERGVDAIALVGAVHPPEIMSLVRGRAIPVVNMFVHDETGETPAVGPDNKRALFEMTDRLLQLGHRRFGVIAQPFAHNDRASARLAGIRAALAEAGLVLRREHLLVSETSSIADGRRLLRLHMTRPERPTAIMCANAYLAVGAMLEAMALKLDVPGELSIVGYDDIELMSELPVPITTVRIRGAEVGARAARFLVASVERRPTEEAGECAFEIIERASSGPAPDTSR